MGGASRAQARRPPANKELLSKGVSYCIDCDDGFFRGDTVALVGGGSAAVSGALDHALPCQPVAPGLPGALRGRGFEREAQARRHNTAR
ncbi:hypothetical protein DFAR_590003 [Desulfarculales bacterium]